MSINYNCLFKSVFITVFVFSFTISSAQSTTPIVQNVGGNIGLQTGLNLNYSIGELASIAYLVAPNNSSLSTGFLHSFGQFGMIFTGVNDLASIAHDQVSILPNPVLTSFKLKTYFQKSGQLQFQIMDAQSNVKYASESINTSGIFEKQINILYYPPGVYYIKLLFKANNGAGQSGVFKIIKL